MSSNGPLSTQTIDRSRVQEAYDSAALSVSRIRSDEINGDVLEEDVLTYYEGRRDALFALLQPEDSDE